MQGPPPHLILSHSDPILIHTAKVRGAIQMYRRSLAVHAGQLILLYVQSLCIQ
jgi:hypothetical protein